MAHRFEFTPEEEKELSALEIKPSAYLTPDERFRLNTLHSRKRLSQLMKIGGDIQCQWLALEDDKDCELCSELHNKVVKPGELFSVSGWEGYHPPCHLGCRCLIVPYNPEYEEIYEELKENLRPHL